MVHSYRQLECPTCGQLFDSLGALRRHAARAHKQETKQSAATPPHPVAIAQSAPQHPSPRTQVTINGLQYAQSRRNVQVHAQDLLLTAGLAPCLETADPQTKLVWLHSSDGLCLCRHCNRTCNSWDDLKVHIFTKACPVLFPNAIDLAAVPTSTNTLGACWDQEIMAKTRSSWEAVAAHLKRTRKNARLYCPLCNQGLVKSKGLTQHFQAYHAWALPTLQVAREHSQETSKGHHMRHAAVCAMIIHAKLLVLLHHPEAIPDGPGRSFEGRLARGSSRAPDPSDGGASGRNLFGFKTVAPLFSPPVSSGTSSEPGGSTQSGGRTAVEVLPAQRQGPGPGGRERPKPQSEPANSHSHLLHASTTASTRTETSVPATDTGQPSTSFGTQCTLQQLGFRRAGDQSGAAVASTRRLPERTCPEYHVGDVPGDLPPTQHHSSTGQDQRAMADHQDGTSQLHSPSTKDRTFPDLGLRAEGQSGVSRHGSRQEAGGHKVRSAGGAEQLPRQKVEPRTSGSRNDHHSCPSYGQGSDQSPRGNHRAQHGGVGSYQLSSDQKAASGHDRSNSDILTSPRPEGLQSLPTLDGDRNTGRECGADASSHDAQKRTPISITACPSSGSGASPRVPRLYLAHVQQAALVNQSNDCYANSTLLACLWTSLQYKPHEVIMRAPLHADLCECLSPRNEPLHLWSRAIWKRCLRHWPHSGRQQDAADFLSHFQQAADLRHFSGSWAVLSEGCLRDCGQVCPLALTCDLSLLPQVRGMCSLQQAIHHWHSSSPHPALTAGAECIAVQLNPILHRG